MESVHQKENILGINTSITTVDNIINDIKNAITFNQKYTIMAINPKKIMLAQSNEQLEKALSNVSCAIPDGFYVVKLSKRIKARITGIDLMQKICEEYKKLNAKIFLYGSSVANVKQTKLALEKKYKNIKIVGYADGYHNENNIINKINNSKANIVFVALGSPNQEIWINNNKSNINASVIMGVGGSFDVICGYIKRAPVFMQKMGLEWLYRFIREPRRMKEIPLYVKYLFLVKKMKRKI